MLNRNNRKLTLASAVAAAGCLLTADVTIAQSSTMVKMLEEVVVTARKRAENLQDVPAAVSAFSATQLQDFGLDELTDVGRMTPNLVMNETSGLVGGAISVFMRGIGNDQGLEQGVGVYVDDVYLNRTTGALLEVMDVERIEVLKGPQGHLYGRNTIGGAIKYITRKPGEELEGTFEVKYGSEDLIRIKGSLSGPIVENTLAGGVSFLYKERDGFQENSFPGSDDPWSADVGVIRGSLVWTPTDNLSIDLTADYLKDESLPPIPNRIGLDEGALGTIGAITTTANAIFGPGTGLFAEPNDLSFPDDVDDVSSEYVDDYDLFEIEQSTVALTVNWDISDQWQLKSVTALRNLKNTQPFDFDGSEQVWITTLRSDLDADDFSQEFQLNYTGDSVAAVMGIYYLDAEQDTAGNVNPQTARLRATQEFFKDTYFDERLLESYSIYGNIDWDFAEDWQLSVGARYTEDEKEEEQRAFVTQGFYALATTAATGPLPLAIAPGMEEIVEASPAFTGWLGNPRFLERTFPEDTYAKEKWDEFTPSVKLSHNLDDDTLVSAGISTGFKSGGFNRTGGNATAYDPETLVTYALGYKSTMADGAVRVNAEVFYNEYEDKQLGAIQLLPSGDLEQIISNVGEISQVGAEVEVTWLTPVDGLMINFNLGWLDYDVDEFETADGDASEFTELGYSPEWSGQLRATYEVDLDDSGTLNFGTDISYQDEMFTNSPIDTRNPLKVVQAADDYYLWNAVAAWRSMDERWRVAVEGRNLTDEREIVNTFDIGIVATAGYTPPRTWAVSVGYSF